MDIQAGRKGFVKKASYRELLLAEIGRRRYEEVAKGFDILGNIAVIDADKDIAKKVARIIIETHKGVETVLRKEGAVRGKYRKRRYGFVLGKRNYIARYNENGCSFAFDVRKAFFSPRLAYERNRITNLSKDGETVVVMFAGVGPFAIEIAKHNRKSKVVAIELNKNAYKYMLENRSINKLDNVFPVLGDAADVPRGCRGSAQRIVMPLPWDSYRFLGSAFAMAGKRCVIHYYAFVEDKGREEEEKLRKFSRSHRRKFRLMGKRVVSSYSTRTSEMVWDFEISRQSS
jgi:tRNA (guanine37-N1)-methyltransferase